MPERITKLRNYLINANFVGTQTFNSRNIAGDKMTTVYLNDGIMVDYCYHWGYLEIFGLTEEEYRLLSDILDIWD